MFVSLSDSLKVIQCEFNTCLCWKKIKNLASVFSDSCDWYEIWKTSLSLTILQN